MVRVALFCSSLISAVILSIAIVPVAHAVPVTVFSDDFEDGDVTDWIVTSSAGVITPVVTVRTDSVHSGTYALIDYFDAPTGGAGANFVRASHTFTAPTFGDYTLSLWARSSICSGCTMFFDVLVDNVLLAHDGTSPSAYKFDSFLLSNLSANVHTLTLGMYTDAASSGRFNASFDDVLITRQVPVPATLALLSLGLAGLGFSRRRQ